MISEARRMVTKITELNANGVRLHVFFIYVATEWKYHAVVHDFVFGVLSGAPQLSGAKVPAATQTPSVYFQG